MTEHHAETKATLLKHHARTLKQGPEREERYGGPEMVEAIQHTIDTFIEVLGGDLSELCWAIHDAGFTGAALLNRLHGIPFADDAPFAAQLRRLRILEEAPTLYGCKGNPPLLSAVIEAAYAEGLDDATQSAAHAIAEAIEMGSGPGFDVADIPRALRQRSKPRHAADSIQRGIDSLIGIYGAENVDIRVTTGRTTTLNAEASESTGTSDPTEALTTAMTAAGWHRGDAERARWVFPMPEVAESDEYYYHRAAIVSPTNARISIVDSLLDEPPDEEEREDAQLRARVGATPHDPNNEKNP